MNDLVFFLYYGVLSYFCIKGIGFLFGFGMQKRWDNWSGDNYIKQKWKRTKDRRYQEYFK